MTSGHPHIEPEQDVVIVGGGPAGLSAALALGRSRKRVLLCDSGPRRNAAAEHVHNFLTQDGTPPGEFRAIARAQLARYPNVEIRDEPVASISGTRGAFRVELPSGAAHARRILLCNGMIDETLPIDGFRELWGRAIFQCPYCHGWENQDLRWGYLAQKHHLAQMLPFVLKLRSWTRDVVLFANGLDLSTQTRERLLEAGIGLEASPVRRLVANGHRLEAIELEDGTTRPLDVLFAHPPQRQVDLVRTLDLALDDGYVRVDPTTRETSLPGIYAAGDLASRAQGAIFAAAAGMQAAAAINVDLAMETFAK